MTEKKREYLSTGASWSNQLLETYYSEIERIATEKFGLDVYPNQLEVITAEQMIDAYSSVAMPIMYDHWSFGKQFIQTMNNYQQGYQGLAYEVVINSSPCIAYLMEENTMMMQALVIAHASFGHNSFFKNNYMFKQWTDAESIIDYLVFAKHYIKECEDKYGAERVEELLDSCHALQQYGVDKYKRPSPLSMAEEKSRQDERAAYMQSQVNDLWRTVPESEKPDEEIEDRRVPSEPQENVLYFIEKNAPHLETWEREIIRIVRKIAQYFYPQMQTKLMNEGYATFWHYTIVNEMYDEGLIDDGYMLEFLESHTAVTTQLPFDSKYFSGINVYALGFAMYQDIKRICMEPTEEDKEWFPDFAGNGDWLGTIEWAMRNFKDESFVEQFLSPKVARDFKLFAIVDDDEDTELEVNAIHDRLGFKKLRESLARNYNPNEMIPNIQAYDVKVRTDRSLTLRHFMHNRHHLHCESTHEMLKHLKRLWGFDIHLESVDSEGNIKAKYSNAKNESLLEIFND